MNPIDKLIAAFERFPGIGPRQARRFVHYLLSTSQANRADLAASIKELGAHSAQCQRCFRWFVKSGSKGALPLCEICSNARRNESLLFIVEKDADIDNVERSGFRGLYFVLGGTVPLGAEEPEKHIRARELLSRVDLEGGEQKLKEIILGLSATTEGDHTRSLLMEKLRTPAETFGIKVSSLGRGLSTGSELEYADPDTIASALSSRQ